MLNRVISRIFLFLKKAMIGFERETSLRHERFSVFAQGRKTFSINSLSVMLLGSLPYLSS